MQKLLSKLEIADFEFLVEIIRGPASLTSDKALRAALDALAVAPDSSELRSDFCKLLERETRYLGSSEIAYLFRKVFRFQPGSGVQFREIILDVYRKLK